MRPEEVERRRTIAANARALGVCPQCGAELIRAGYGTGSNADGLFCTLECLARYWYTENPSPPRTDG